MSISNLSLSIKLLAALATSTFFLAYGNSEEANYLINHYADDALILQKIRESKKPQDLLLSVFFKSISAGRIFLLQLLLRENKEIFWEKNSRGENALYIASNHNQASIVQLFIELDQYHCLRNQSTPKKNNSAHAAAYQGNTQILNILLINPNNTVNTNLLTEKNHVGYTPFLIACKANKLEAVKYFIDLYAKVFSDMPHKIFSEKTAYGLNALHFAVIDNHMELANYLINLNARMVLDPDNEGHTPLRTAYIGLSTTQPPCKQKNHLLFQMLLKAEECLHLKNLPTSFTAWQKIYLALKNQLENFDTIIYKLNETTHHMQQNTSYFPNIYDPYIYQAYIHQYHLLNYGQENLNILAAQIYDMRCCAQSTLQEHEKKFFDYGYENYIKFIEETAKYQPPGSL